MVYIFGLHQKIKAFYIYLLIRYIQNALIFLSVWHVILTIMGIYS